MGSRRLASFPLRAAQVSARSCAEVARAQGGRLAAEPLDPLEELPARVGEFVGEPLHVPGAARRVDHPGQVRLLDEDRGGVAGDTARERVRQAERVVEGQHGDRVGAAHSGGQRGDRRAQHVHPRVAARHHHRRGHDVLELRPRARAPRRPRPPAPTAGARPAAWRSSGTGRRSPRTGTPAAHRPVRRSAPPPVSSRRYATPVASEQPSSWAAEPPASWYGSASTVSARSPGYSSAHSRASSVAGATSWRCPVRASWPSGSAPRLPRAASRATPRSSYSRSSSRAAGSVVAPRVEDDGCQVEVDAVEDPAEGGHRDAALADGQPEGGDAVLQVREHRGAVGHRVPLPYVPAADRVPLGAAAAHEGREPGQAGLGRGVAGGVEGPGAQPVLQRGGQGFLGLGSRDVLARFAQHTRHKALPLLMGRVRELGGQREPVVRQDRHARMLGHINKRAAEGTAVTLPSP